MATHSAYEAWTPQKAASARFGLGAVNLLIDVSNSVGKSLTMQHLDSGLRGCDEEAIVHERKVY